MSHIEGACVCAGWWLWVGIVCRYLFDPPLSLPRLWPESRNSLAYTDLQLWRVDIIDSKTGVCLFERIWKWSGPCNPETSASICNLILTFYMFSKELDSGGTCLAPFLLA